MASTLISPGVLARENNSSQVSQQPVVVGAAIVGPTAKGPIQIPTLVTSYQDYISKFGSSINITSASITNTYSYFTSIAVYNYFLNGGQTMLVTRVVSGSYLPAVSTAISASTQAASQPAFTLETLSQGAIMNSTGSEINGSLISGSNDNLRWEIVSPNTASGTFTLLVRRGNDQSPINKVILEQYTNVSLDPNASNYVAAVVGDQTYTYTTDSSTGAAYLQLSGSYPNRSRYVRVKSVNLTTPNYLNNYGVVSNTAYTASIPLAASGSFGSATGTVSTSSAFYEQITNTNIQGLVASNYTNSIALLANKDDYQYNVLLTPGLINNYAAHASVQSTIISNTQDRGDNIYVMDLVGFGAQVGDVTGQAIAAPNTTYAAAYWPWVFVQDPATGKNVWVPASTVIGGVYAYTDTVAGPWFAPAGINRGGLGSVIRPERKLSQGDRDTLYQNSVNPIASFPGTGVVVYGNKTTTTVPSALDRVNVRRLLITLKSYISQIANNLVFEQNTTTTRNIFLSQVNPYLASVQQRQGLYAFKVVMDSTNNTPDTIDRNQLIGQIFIQPTKTAEFIYLDFNITPTGVSFS
jgi:phage tail sheath protein FI